MRLKKTVAVALATALLATTAAVPAFAASTKHETKVYFENDAYKATYDSTNVAGFSSEDATRKTTGTTNVKYVVHEAYTWTIPAEIDFGADQGINKTVVVNTSGTGTEETNVVYADANTESKVYVEKNVIPENKTLKIKVSSSSWDDTANKFYVKNDGASFDKKLAYTITGKTELKNNDEVLTVAAGTNQDTQMLVFKLSTETTDTAETAGTYKDTLTFTATVE